jgi:two-component system sensor histidine kinase YesM
MQNIDQYILPKITLQPIVENAINHGILENPDKSGAIRMTGFIDDDRQIHITISDDGQGIDEHQLNLMSTGQAVSSDGSGFGFNSIGERLAIFFGVEKAVKIYSKKGVGTSVSLIFPAVEQQDSRFSH